MNMEAKYLWKFTLTSRTLLENPLVLAFRDGNAALKFQMTHVFLLYYFD